ncbi:MAG: NAD(P)+ transhydrogenase beta chain [Rhizobium sp.]|nr:NAD(P)+ transhydrogenase beta chain [Rhizobium sp.]
MQKPSYSTSKRALWLSSIMAWIVILILAVGAAMGGKAVEFGSIAVPSMVALIAALLGIHRFTGSLDFRASQVQATEAPAAPPHSARDEPTSGDTR